MTKLIAEPKRGWRDFYLDLARRIKCETAWQKHLLLHYVALMNKDGTFSTSGRQVNAETNLSESSIFRGNTSFKTVNLLDWLPGWGNGIEGKPNDYQFDLSRLQKLAESGKAIPKPDR